MTFDEITGHEQPKRILLRALAANELAHAYLFSGESRIGKFATAMALAAAVNCRSRGDRGGCGACLSCRQAASRTHPDIRIVMPESEDERLLATWSAREAEKASNVIKIDQIREAQQGMVLTPTGDGSKVLVVDGAETLNEEAQNAFLKTLEEPPGSALIILVSSRPQSLLPTIRSRCQEVVFHPLPRVVLAELLVRRRGVSGNDARFLAALARGRAGAALLMDAQQERDARSKALDLWQNLKQMSAADVLVCAEALVKDREQLERFLEVGIEWLRDVLVYRETGDPSLLVNEHASDRTESWSGGTSTPRLLADLDLFIQSREHLERNVNTQLVAENLLLNLGRP